MSDSLEYLRHKLSGVKDLKSLVRTMKVLSASNIHQYEKAVLALNDYYKTIELGLIICLHNASEPLFIKEEKSDKPSAVGAVVFGSDQGLVGQFNDVLSNYVFQILDAMPGDKIIWAVGDRAKERIEDRGLPIAGVLGVPNSVHSISSVVGQILLESHLMWESGEISQFYIFHNKPQLENIYKPVFVQLLPLDDNWRRHFAQMEWVTSKIPEALNGVEFTLRGLIRNYLFITLFQACAESLESENASRLAAMQRAEENIDDLLDLLNLSFNQLRQSSIDEELFDVISGAEALLKDRLR